MIVAVTENSLVTSSSLQERCEKMVLGSRSNLYMTDENRTQGMCVDVTGGTVYIRMFGAHK